MPTKEWFRENPKVTAYISPSLHSELEKYMEETGIKKVSQAITAILEEKLTGKKTQKNNDLSQEIDILKAKVAQIELLIKDSLNLTFKTKDEEETQKRIESRYNQLTLTETQPTNKEEKEPIPVEQSKPKVWQTSTKEIEEKTGLTRKKLEYRWKRNQLPYTVNGITIVKWIEKEKKPPYSNIWEVQEASPN